MTDLEKTIQRDLLERLIIQFRRGANDMEMTIALAGDHYTYRDRLRMHSWAASELEREHLYLLGYEESSERLRAMQVEIEAERQEALANPRPLYVPDED
jgi:hypothetical protein